MKRVVILGSTGSVGRNACRVAEALRDRVQVVGVAAKTNAAALAEQAEKLGCSYACIAEPKMRDQLSAVLPGHCRALAGLDGILEMVRADNVDMVLCSIVGTGGLIPVMEALRAGREIALASKEVLVMAGSVVMPMVKRYHTRLIPVDSEHSAIYQCLGSRAPANVERLILTASGGPFRKASPEEMKNATWERALAHPTWSMGQKVTIDSATLMNKALEMIEAHHLFNVPENKIKVVIHRQSVIHSMVELVDGALLAQMSVPDMRFAIQYALSYPQRLDGGLPKFDFAKLGQISFELPDEVKYPALNLSRQAMRIGGTMPTVLNAANEVAVERFKQGAVKFPDIWKIVDETMEKHHAVTLDTLECALEADRWARKIAYGIEFRA